MTNSKYQRFSLGTIQDVSFKLVVPTKHNLDKYPLYYLEYYFNKKQDKIKAGVKDAYISFINWLKHQPKMATREKEEKLAELYAVNIKQVIADLNLDNSPVSNKRLTIYSGVIEAINVYFSMQEEQFARGELADIANYKDRNKRLIGYFTSNNELTNTIIKELNANLWDGFRTYLRHEKLSPSSINQYITYVRSFYNWLIDFKEIPISNHPKKLKKLDTSRQVPKYKELSNEIISEYYKVLENDNDRWLRLNILTRLVAENTVRPVQVRNIQAKHINLEQSEISIFDRKGKKWRIIIITNSTKVLIEKIFNNTINAKIEIEPNDYLIGGSNQFKKGLPQSQGSFRDLQVAPFRRLYPQFKDVQNYDFKTTTITRTSQKDLVGTQKRAGHAKASTTQIYDKSDSKSRAISIEELLKIG